MSEFEKRFKMLADVLKTEAHKRQILQHQSADIQYQAYCQALDDMMRTCMDAGTEGGND